ncbi:uncharacterized protein CBL_13720 [Carabus blaptoides fortunei]
MNDELQVKEASVLRRCAFKLGLHLCSHVGLVSLVVVYTLLGAVIFAFIEGDHYVVERGLIQHSREECLKELWTITGLQLHVTTCHEIFNASFPQCDTASDTVSPRVPELCKGKRIKGNEKRKIKMDFFENRLLPIYNKKYHASGNL